MKELALIEEQFREATRKEASFKRDLPLAEFLRSAVSDSGEVVDATMLSQQLKDNFPHIFRPESGDPGHVLAEVFALLHSTLATHLSNEINGMMMDVLELAGHRKRAQTPGQVLVVAAGSLGDEVPAAGNGAIEFTAKRSTDILTSPGPIWPIHLWGLAPFGKRKDSAFCWPAIVPRDFLEGGSPKQLSALVLGCQLKDIENLRHAPWRFVADKRDDSGNSETYELLPDLGWAALNAMEHEKTVVKVGRSNIAAVDSGDSVEEPQFIGTAHWLNWRCGGKNSDSVEGADSAVSELHPPAHPKWEVRWKRGWKNDSWANVVENPELFMPAIPESSNGQQLIRGQILVLRNDDNDTKAPQLWANTSLAQCTSSLPVPETVFPSDEPFVNLKDIQLRSLTPTILLPSHAETETEFLARASNALRHRDVAVTRKDWIDIVRDVSPKINLCEVRDAYFTQAGSHGKGVQVFYHCSEDRSGDLNKLLLPRVWRAIEERLPMGIRFEIVLPVFIEGEIAVRLMCIPREQQLDNSKTLNVVFRRQLKQRVTLEKEGDYWHSVLGAFRRNNTEDPKFTEMVEHYCEEKLFTKDDLHKPRVPQQDIEKLPEKTLRFQPSNNSIVKKHDYCMSLRYRVWPVAQVNDFVIWSDSQ